MEKWTPFILFGLVGLSGLFTWIIKSLIKYGNDITAIQTTLEIYLKARIKGEALVLDSPNPTPPEMRIFLRRLREETITPEEQRKLENWLRSVRNDPNAGKTERSSANEILASMKALGYLEENTKSH